MVSVPFFGREGFGKPAEMEDRQAVGRGEQLVQVLGDHQDGGAGFGEIEQGLVNARGGAGVDAPSGLGGDQHLWALLDFATDDELLQIAAGKRSRFRSGAPMRARRNGR